MIIKFSKGSSIVEAYNFINDNYNKYKPEDNTNKTINETIEISAY